MSETLATMQKLTIGDLSLGLANLMADRKPRVDGCAAGKLFGPMLAKKQAAIEGLPEALRRGKPLAEELAHVDDDYDGFGGGLYAYTEAILLAPSMSPDERAAAQRIRDAFIPRKAALSDSYAEEAATAKRNRSKLAERKADLELFPVPGGKTLYDWALAFLDKGDEIDGLLNQRSLAGVGQGTRATAAALRSDTVGLLYQFRAAVKAEIEDKGLPAALEEQIFSYFDELSARRPSKKPAAKPEGVKAEPAIQGGTNE
jgi:hypothetical protein